MGDPGSCSSVEMYVSLSSHVLDRVEHGSARTLTRHGIEASLARGFVPLRAFWMAVSTSSGHNGCRSARSCAAAVRWLSRASPRRSTRMGSSLADCEVSTQV